MNRCSDISIQSLSQPGAYHRFRKMEGQDRIFELHTDRLWILGLADGAGSLKHSGEGAESALRTAGNYWISNFKELWDYSEEKIAHLTLEYVRYELEKMASREKEPMKDYGSTLLLYGICLENGREMLLHLGDGAIAAWRDGKAAVYSRPENGKTRNQTFLTTGEGAADHARVRKMEGLSEQIFLCSDGVYKADEAAENTVLEVNPDTIRKFLEEQEPEDDYSYILLRNHSL